MTTESAASPTGSAPAAPAAAAPAAATPAASPAAPAAVAAVVDASTAAPAASSAPAAPAAVAPAPAAPAAPANETPEAKTAREASEKTARDATEKAATEKAASEARVNTRNEYGKEIADNVKRTQTAWDAAAKIDPEYGGEKFEENKGIARSAMAAYCTPEFVEFIDKAGLGNHPEMLRAFFRIGKDIAQDKLVVGRQASGTADKNVANMLWPNLK